MPFSFMVDDLQEEQSTDIGIMLLGWPSFFAYAVLVSPFTYFLE